MQIPGREIHWFESLDSTMFEAARLARAGCPAGTVVGADEQTAGQGRLGRQWHSERASGLYCSIVLRFTGAGPNPAVTLALGLAARAAIARVTGLTCDLRWPNDLLAGDRKVAGILAELCDGTAVIAGIGINVNHEGMPQELREIATSLRMETGREWPRETLLAALVEEIDRWVAVLVGQGVGAVIAEFEVASTYVRGKGVTVDMGDRSVDGVTDGLDADGFLWIVTETGRRERVVAGGVRPRR
jgi:BirA family transcriptional regulator, biotin operon repressor / biotin---[acetyl-CoA-carboxylase] ligase